MICVCLEAPLDIPTEIKIDASQVPTEIKVPAMAEIKFAMPPPVIPMIDFNVPCKIPDKITFAMPPPEIKVNWGTPKEIKVIIH